ncbi:LOW QUALITY PROTEIN: immunoglobulin superfamily member 22 [Leptosomus discolor]
MSSTQELSTACAEQTEEVVSRKFSALLESFSMVSCSFEILAGESIPEFVEKPCPLTTPEGVPIQFVSNLKNTQVKKKGKACLECVLTYKDVILKGMKNGQMIEIEMMKHEGKRAELTINAAELSDSGDCTHGEYVCDVHALTGDPAELRVVLNGPKVEEIWLKDDSPVIRESVLKLFAALSITVKTKRTTSIKVPFKAKPVPKVTWFKDGIEVAAEEKVVMEKDSGCITIETCVREDSGAIMLNLKNRCGSASDNPYLNFLLTLQTNQNPHRGKQSSCNTRGKCKIRWRAPKGSGGKQVTRLVIQRRVAAEKNYIKIGVVESNCITFAMEKVEEGKAYFRICAVSSAGLIEPLETEEIFAGECSLLRQVCQSQVVNVRKEAVTITWNSPAQDEGSPVQSYIIEKRKKGSNLCVPVTKEPVPVSKWMIFWRIQNEFHVIDEPCKPWTSHQPLIAKDPIKPPGLLEVVDFSSSSISLAWWEPDGDVLSGYMLEMAEDTKKWTKCTKIPISSTTYTAGGLHFPPPTNLHLVEEIPDTVTLNHSSGVEDDQTDYGVLKCDVSTTMWFTAAEKVYSSKTVAGLLPGRKYF